RDARTPERRRHPVPALCQRRINAMTTTPALLAPYVQAFFVEHLPQHKRLSPHTIASCRDTFRLLLHFMQHTRGIEPSALRVPDLEAPTILAFLDALEQIFPAHFGERRTISES